MTIEKIHSKPKLNYTNDIRDSLLVLPYFIQPFLTWLTGKPYSGQKSFGFSAHHHVWSGVISLVMGIFLSCYIIFGGGLLYVLLPLCYMFTVHGARKLRLMIIHQCSHINCFGMVNVDSFLGRAISITLITQNFDSYTREHIGDHHSIKHMTIEDPTVKFLILNGFRPGLSRKQLWSNLGKVLLSPIFHIRFFLTRVTSQFIGTTSIYKFSFLLVHITVLALVVSGNYWKYYLFAFFLPITVFYQMSACIRLCTKHIFPKAGSKLGGKKFIAQATHGIFICEHIPIKQYSRYKTIILWCLWWFRLFWIHLPSRMLVMVGDSVCHDYHHRFPKAKDWANYIFSRQNDLLAGHKGWPEYTEVWGLYNAIDAVFTSLSEADPKLYDILSVQKFTFDELYAAVDE